MKRRAANLWSSDSAVRYSRALSCSATSEQRAVDATSSATQWKGNKGKPNGTLITAFNVHARAWLKGVLQ
jgi:hypothetical protein